MEKPHEAQLPRAANSKEDVSCPLDLMNTSLPASCSSMLTIVLGVPSCTLHGCR